MTVSSGGKFPPIPSCAEATCSRLEAFRTVAVITVFYSDNVEPVYDLRAVEQANTSFEKLQWVVLMMVFV